MIICMLNLSASNFKIKIKQYLANHNFIIMIISIEIWCVKEGDTPVEYFLDNWQPYSWEWGVLYIPDSPAHPKPNLEIYKPEKNPLRENIRLIQTQWK